MATPGNQPSSATCTDILRCSVVEFSVSSSWGMMPKCDLVLRETDVVCTVQTTVKCTIKLEDLVGINVVQKPHPLNSLACQMDIHSYPLVSVGLFGKTSRRLATTSFCFYQEPTFRENLYAAVQWKKAINKQCRRTMRKVFCCEESGVLTYVCPSLLARVCCRLVWCRCVGWLSTLQGLGSVVTERERGFARILGVDDN